MALRFCQIGGMVQVVCVVVGDTDRNQLVSIAEDRNRPQEHIQLARIVLLSGEGLAVAEVARQVGISRPAVWRWQARYAEAGVDALLRDKTRPPGTAKLAMATVAKVLALTCSEPAVRMLVAEVLEDLGCTAIEVEDGVAGLRVLRSDARIDLLITDVGLPGGSNGRQVADAARAARPGLRVLFITGYAENAVVGNGHLEPGMQVLTKPFAMETLANRVRDLMAQPHEGAPKM